MVRESVWSTYIFSLLILKLDAQPPSGYKNYDDVLTLQIGMCLQVDTNITQYNIDNILAKYNCQVNYISINLKMTTNLWN